MTEPGIKIPSRNVWRLSNSLIDTSLEAGKLPPQAPELEQAILGALMLTKAAVAQVADLLLPESFYVDAHKRIYAVIAELYTAGLDANILSVTQGLKKKGELDIAGGAFYISQLTNKVSGTESIMHWAMIVVQKHMMREVIRSASDAMRDAYDETSDVFEVLDKYEEGLRVCQAYMNPRTLASAADDAEKVVDGDVPEYIEFNTPALRQFMVQKGLVHTIGGRTGMGKSVVSTSEAWGWTKRGRVVMFSPEMTKRQVQSRILAQESGVAYNKIMAGKWNEEKQKGMTPEEQALVAQAWIRIAPRMKLLLIDETSHVTPRQAQAKLDRALAGGPVVAVVVDHLHEMTSGIPKIDNDSSSRAKVSYCIDQLGAMAKKTDLPFVVFAQLSRAPEGRGDNRPQISDLFWSSDIDTKSAMIILLYRQSYYKKKKLDEDTLEWIVAKYRDGGLGSFYSKVVLSLSYIGDTTEAPPEQPSGRKKGKGHDDDDNPF